MKTKKRKPLANPKPRYQDDYYAEYAALSFYKNLY